MHRKDLPTDTEMCLIYDVTNIAKMLETGTQTLTSKGSLRQKSTCFVVMEEKRIYRVIWSLLYDLVLIVLASVCYGQLVVCST